MKKETTALLLCSGFVFSAWTHAIEWEPVPSTVSPGYSDNSSYYQSQQRQQQERYESNSGAQYQYDMGNPVERNRYSLDLDAQRRDMQSADPRRSTDRASGQYGGGIYND